uniref:Twin-arginine translocation pathway signal n=1 Tax=Cereibacter sphaeroides (strain ATCC 17025 / ATH 2.4.3) TaxID=349102 RepID=A4WNT1_CERS5
MQPDRITRRAALAAPLALAAAPAAAAEARPQETPVLRLFREWEAMDAQIDKLSGEAADAMLADLLALELRLRSTPSTGVADFAAKVVAFSFWGGACLDACDAPEIWAEARALLGVLPRA